MILFSGMYKQLPWSDHRKCPQNPQYIHVPGADKLPGSDHRQCPQNPQYIHVPGADKLHNFLVPCFLLYKHHFINCCGLQLASFVSFLLLILRMC